MFEIHVTVEAEDFSKFKSHCEIELSQQFKVKPIIIDLQTSKQVMTSSKHKGYDYANPLNKICCDLEQLGYTIIRKKVEFNPYFISEENVLYHESHIRTTISLNEIDSLKSICDKHDWHLSRNIYKILPDNKVNILCTFRTRKTRQQFIDLVSNFSKILQEAKIPHDKVEIEACVLDTKEQLDNNWLNTNKLS